MDAKDRIDLIMKDVVVGEELKDKIMKQTVHKKRGKIFAAYPACRVAVAAALAVVVFSVMTPAAADMVTGIAGKWQKEVAKSLDVEERQQENISKGGYSQDLQAAHTEKDVLTATDNGITITAKQTLVDKYAMYVYLEIKSEKGVKLDKDEQFFRKWDVVGGKFDNKNAGMQELENKNDYVKGYVLHMGNCMGSGSNMIGKKIELHFKDLMSENIKNPNEKEKVVVKGEWNLSWIVKGNNKTITIPMNKTVKGKDRKMRENGYKLYLKQIEVSALSCRLYYKESGDARRYIPIKYKMKDGTKRNIYGFGSGDTDKETGLDIQTDIFDTGILDIDNLYSVIIEGEEFLVEE